MARIDAIREVCITEQTFYRWRKQYGGMGRAYPPPASSIRMVLKKNYVPAIPFTIRIKRIGEEQFLNPVDEDLVCLLCRHLGLILSRLERRPSYCSIR